jgi:ISXO2-like transposase domain
MIQSNPSPLTHQTVLAGVKVGYHTASNKGQAKHGGKKHLGRRARGRRKKREPGRGHYDKDRPAIIAWVSRQGVVVVQVARDFTVKTVQKAADIAVQAGSRLYTDSASSYRALKGYNPSLRCIGTFGRGTPVLTALTSRQGSGYIDT